MIFPVVCLCLAVLTRPGDCVLDLATGTGDLLLEELISGAVKSVGADLSLGMLRLARPKFEREGHKDARVCQGDAERLPFGDARFDGASGRACLTHFGPMFNSALMI